jgi:hypothetical protein
VEVGDWERTFPAKRMKTTDKDRTMGFCFMGTGVGLEVAITPGRLSYRSDVLEKAAPGKEQSRIFFREDRAPGTRL